MEKIKNSTAYTGTTTTVNVTLNARKTLKKPVDPPKRSLLEEIGNSITHGVGSVFSVVAFILMLTVANTVEEKVGAIVYFVGLFVLFTMSCLYHAFRHGSAVKRLFRRFDYSSIYLLIGATFAPILLCYVGGTFGTAFFIAQWSIIAVGISLVGAFGPSRLRWIHIPLYLLLGWSGLAFVPQMLTNNIGLFITIIAGGIIYSLGVIPFAIKKKCSHFIWHFFVLGGAVVQWVGIYLFIFLA
ncbi:MAG: hemolysin III family protein [Clostridia bacterium]|nr:hemolysin III family protein [Clostridia bacterium]